MGTKIDKDTWGCSIVIHFLNNIHLTSDNGGYQIVIVLPAQDWVYTVSTTRLRLGDQCGWANSDYNPENRLPQAKEMSSEYQNGAF